MSVSSFLERTRGVIRAVGGTPSIHGTPSEMPNATPFAKDTTKRPYDAEAVMRYHQALLRIHAVMQQFRTSFLGKVSPVHLFWGALDLAVTRFSGRRAPPHPGGIPALPDAITREAYSHEVISAGFWPGGNGYDEAAFYAYAYPTPAALAEQPAAPEAAFWHRDMGEFVLSYARVREASDPDAELERFLHSTFDAAAALLEWPAGLVIDRPPSFGRPPL
jgi:hypothetical protein